jgi:hypothetical protein
MRRLLVHIRRNAVAYVALFVALGGTSYAAFDIPNHSIDPVKFDPNLSGLGNREQPGASNRRRRQAPNRVATDSGQLRSSLGCEVQRQLRDDRHD